MRGFELSEAQQTLIKRICLHCKRGRCELETVLEILECNVLQGYILLELLRLQGVEVKWE